MTLSVLPAATTVLLGLLVVGTLDFLDSDGDTHWVAWVAFGLATAIVARDTLLGGGLLPFGRGDETRRRPQILGLELHGADVRLRVPRFEPIATTLAILLGLLTTQTIDFANSQGDATAWGWTVFALSITLVTGMRLSPSPRRRKRAEQRQRRDWEGLAREFEARAGEIINDIETQFRRQH